MKTKVLLLLIIVFSLSSCLNKRLSKIKQDVQSSHDSLVLAKKNVDKKIKTGELSLEMGKKLQDTLNSLEAQSTDYMKNLDKAMNSNNVFVKNNVIVKINKNLDNFINVSNDLLNDYEDVKSLDVMNDFMLDESFPPGGYEIPESSLPAVKDAYKYLIDKIIVATNKKKPVPYVVHISILGFSDGTHFGDSSPTRLKLIEEFNLPLDAPGYLINEKLSLKRAQEIRKIVVDLLEQRKVNLVNRDKVQFDIREVGKGEELPFSDKTYGQDDKNRRIVRVQWFAINKKYYTGENK
ncbi:MAG: hypothetical protein MUE53_02445 [Chitinophagales bacterium]|jgi:hypothetical protein|nr:hypothetical protein [Chitinophagales bacterium]